MWSTCAAQKLSVGTDNMHGYLAVDVAYLVEFGASHATSLAAAAASISSIRILRRGLLANLLAVEGNPLDDISCLRRIKLVAEGKMSTFLS